MNTTPLSLPSPRQIHWHKQSLKFARFSKRKRMIAQHRRAGLPGVDETRTKAAQMLGGADARPVPHGTIPAGRNSDHIALWRAGKGGPVFLEKVTENPHEYASCRYLVGAQLRHSPLILGVAPHESMFHLFIEQVRGENPDHITSDLMARLIPASHELAQDITATIAGRPDVETYHDGLLTASWVRRHLAASGLDLDALDADLATLKAAPQFDHHCDLTTFNVLVDGEDFSIIDLGSIHRGPIGGDLCVPLILALGAEDMVQTYNEAFWLFVNMTQSDPALVHLSTHIQATELALQKALWHRSPLRFEWAVRLLRARHDAPPKTAPWP